MNLGTRLWVWLKGELVGSDRYGNTYYRQRNWRFTEKGAGKFSRERRWVIYAGDPEASKVPPEWHGWMHHTVMDPPTGSERSWPWQKPHQENLTGTPHAWRPRGSLLRGGPRAPATGDYEAWKPE